MIPYGRQDIQQEDVEAVVEVLQSDFLTQGPQVPSFELALCEQAGAEYAVATNSATSSLHLACLAVGVEHGDWVWTSPISFVASANCALFCGAKVDFVDIDPQTWNLCPRRLEENLVQAQKEGRLPKVVIPVHLAGLSCDMPAIYRLSEKYGFKIIEDASHAIGGTQYDSKIGSCRYSDVTVFSFHPVKIVTTGEGGAALTQNRDLAEKMRRLRSHGVTRDEKLMKEASHGGWYYEQIELGYNYRMTDMQAALGVRQLSRLERFVDKRLLLTKQYNEALKNMPLTLPSETVASRSAAHLYIVRLDLEKIPLTHREVFESLRARGIGVQLHYIPIYKQPYYREFNYTFQDCPNAEAYYKEAISLPLYYALSNSLQQEVIESIKDILLPSV